MQPQPHIVTRGQYRVHLRGKVHQQPGQLSDGFWRRQLVKIIITSRDAAYRASASSDSTRSTIAGALKSGCRCWQFRAAVCTGDVTDRRPAGQARTAGRLAGRVAPAARELARLPRTAGPGAQQRRLPAAGRSRDDRHLPRRRAIQGSDKITPVDQPGSCWSHRQRSALVSTPDTSGAGHAVRHLLSRYQGQRACCQPRALSGLLHSHARAAAVPSRPALSRCGESPRSVMTSYLPRSNPRPVDRLVKENDMTPATSFAAPTR